MADAVGDFAPAFYTGEGTAGWWHEREDCPLIRGRVRRGRLGAARVSGKTPCTHCVTEPAQGDPTS